MHLVILHIAYSWMLTCAFSAITHICVTSLTSGSYDPLDILDKICRVKVGEHVAVVDSTQASVSTHQQSEQGYLNLTSPLVPSNTKGTEESSNTSDQVWKVVGFDVVVAFVWNSKLSSLMSVLESTGHENQNVEVVKTVIMKLGFHCSSAQGDMPFEL